MALEFISEIPTDRVLHAFNNNEVQFRSTSTQRVINAKISIGSVSVTITPGPLGIFTFNFKEVFKLLTNKTQFREGIYDGLSETSDIHIKKDVFVFANLVVGLSIELEDGTEEFASRQYRVLRSVIQVEDYRRGLTNESNTEIALLTPFTMNSNKTYSATMFDGLPYDIAIYAKQSGSVLIYNKSTEFSMQVSVTSGVNRFIFADGLSDVSLDDFLPMILGVNEIEISSMAGSPEDKLTLFLTKKEACSGYYLKWFNNLGGWCYYLFTENKQTARFKETGDFPHNYGNIDSLKDTFTSLGFEGSKNIELIANQMSLNEKRYMNTLHGSPKIYLYLNPPFKRATRSSFIDVKLDSRKIELEQRYLRSYDIKFEIEYPSIYTLKS